METEALDVLVNTVLSHLPSDVFARISVIRALVNMLPQDYERLTELLEILHHYEAAQKRREELQLQLFGEGGDGVPGALGPDGGHKGDGHGGDGHDGGGL